MFDCFIGVGELYYYGKSCCFCSVDGWIGDGVKGIVYSGLWFKYVEKLCFGSGYF